MEIDRKLFTERKWAFILIGMVTFFIPMFYFWADNINMHDKCMAGLTCFVIFIALCTIDLFLKNKGEKIYLSILFALSVVPNMIVWGYLYISQLCMKRDMFWVIYNTNTSESIEYFGDFISWGVISVTIIYIACGAYCIWKADSKQSLPLRKYLFLFIFVAATILTSIVLQYTVQAIPTFDFYKSGVLYWRENQIFQQEKELRKNLKMEVECTLPEADRVFVVILGESTSVRHMSLYGYHRETTPSMDSVRNELDVYTDVVTPETHTFGAMQKILTFADHKHPEYFKQKPSIVEVFDAAGFETYWISNQPSIDKWGGSYGIIAQESEHLYDLSPFKKDDEIVLPYLEKVLNDTIRGNKMIFIHLWGNHHAYDCRYPDEYEYFDHKKTHDLPGLGFRDEDMKTTIDSYDNSIRYGDFVYSSILKQIKATGKPAYLLFFSDHGEEVYDTRDAVGHHMANVYPCQAQIPFVLWRSDKYKEEMPGLVINTSRPYTTENVIFSISTLSGLKYKEYKPEKSIFSTEYTIPEKRIVRTENYEDILKKVK